jgi:hypothetical protein
MQFPSNGANGSSIPNGSGRSVASSDTTFVTGAGPGVLCSAHSIETELLAAKNVLDERHDFDQVNAGQEHHEIKRVAEPVGAAGASRH